MRKTVTFKTKKEFYKKAAFWSDSFRAVFWRCGVGGYRPRDYIGNCRRIFRLLHGIVSEKARGGTHTLN